METTEINVNYDSDLNSDCKSESPGLQEIKEILLELNIIKSL